jgi:hypothetical protein
MTNVRTCLGVAVCAIALGTVVSSCSGGSPTAPGPLQSRGELPAAPSTPNPPGGPASPQTTGAGDQASQVTAPVSTAAAGQARIAVCHFDGAAGAWSKISVPEPAVNAHTSGHDDALPGGTTTLTRTPLDADCSRVDCPCYDTAYIVALFAPGEPERKLTCGYGFGSTWIHDLDPAREPKYVVESLVYDTDRYRCEKYTLLTPGSPDPDPEAIEQIITRPQHEACVGVIGAAQAALGCGQ